MARLEIEGLEELKRDLDEFQREQLPFALAVALNSVAFKGRENAISEMKAVFDRPTPFALNSVRVYKTDKTKLSAKIDWKQPERLTANDHYLAPQVAGGGREFKPFEARLRRAGILPSGFYAVPGKGVQLDAYGNVPRSEILTLLSWLDAFGEGGYKANMTDATRAKRQKGTAKKYGEAYFVVFPGQKSHLHSGIYKRVYSGFGVAIRSVFIFVKSVNYKKRLDLEKIAEDTLRDNFKKDFDDAMDYALKTALKK